MDIDTLQEFATQLENYKAKSVQDLSTVMSLDIPVVDKIFVLQEIYFMYDELMKEIEVQMDQCNK